MSALQLGFNDAAERRERQLKGFAMGSQLRDQAVSDLEQGRDAMWQGRAFEALKIAAGIHVELTTDDVWHVLERWQEPAPSEPKSMAAVVLRGVREGPIVAADRAPRASCRPECKARPLRVWKSLIYWARQG
ncbi:MAG: hypothetical protein KDK70_39365 [Myxococcales bacterium]|nr:hypothetical protein [Myxococcales bacterium]